MCWAFNLLQLNELQTYDNIKEARIAALTLQNNEHDKEVDHIKAELHEEKNLNESLRKQACVLIYLQIEIWFSWISDFL